MTYQYYTIIIMWETMNVRQTKKTINSYFYFIIYIAQGHRGTTIIMVYNKMKDLNLIQELEGHIIKCSY